MNAKELIGKEAIRTAPNKHPDYSYCSDAVFIVNATDNHIVIKSKGIFDNGKEYEDITPHILDCRFCDDNWTDYQELINPINTLKEKFKEADSAPIANLNEISE